MLPISKNKKILQYHAPWPVYAMNWCQKPDKEMKLAVGSFIEDYNNKVHIVSQKDDSDQLYLKSSFDHPYPVTKIVWVPDYKYNQLDLLATSADYLRIWKCDENETKLECLLNENQNSDFCAPLTSLDWNVCDPTLIGTCSIDTTCTIWCLETGQVVGRTGKKNYKVSGFTKAQLIAHDKEVFDIAFARAGGWRDMFATVGADGSLRIFDLRHLGHSTIVYEDPENRPLVRLDWNKVDHNYLATFAINGTDLILIDVRFPNKPAAQLNSLSSKKLTGMNSSNYSILNGFVWAPHSSSHLVSINDDCQALIWDVSGLPSVDDPILAYRANGEINQVQWSSPHTEWLATCYNNTLEVLKY